MARPDGRIEKGQRLGSAISARAWNRAQNAADVVLGATPGFSVATTQPSRIDYLTVEVNKTNANALTAQWPAHIQNNDAGHKLNVGFAMSNDINFSGFRAEQEEKAELDDLDTFTTENQFLSSNSFQYNQSRFGVITNVTVLPSVYSVTLAVGGVFACRCLAFAKGQYLVGPASIPTTTAVRPLWYPYPVAAPVGVAEVLGYGNYYKLTANEWPRIYEVLVKM